MRSFPPFRSRLLLLLIILNLFATFADNASVLELYEKAISKTEITSYKAEIPKLNFTEFPGISKATYYRKVEDDGFVMLRADFFKTAGQPEWTLLKNRDGQYAIHVPSGKTAKGGSFLRLFYLESMMNRPLSEGLRRFAAMTIDNVHINNRPCTKITIRFPQDIDKKDGPPLSWLTGMPGPMMSDEVKKLIPFVREIYIDKETGAILSIRHFNEHGKRIREMSLGNVTFNPDWSHLPHLFDSPPKPAFQVGNLYQFRQLLKGASGVSKIAENPWARKWRILRNALEGRLGICLFLGIAIACPIGIFIVRRRQIGK